MYVYIHIYREREREIMLFIAKKPKGRSIMISNATDLLKESRKKSLLKGVGCTSICVWLVCDLVLMCVMMMIAFIITLGEIM